MQNIVIVILPFFVLVLCGFLAAQQKILPEAAIPGMNIFVLYFALPCLLFRFGTSKPFTEWVDPILIGIYTLCALLIMVLTIAMTLRLRSGGDGVDLKNAAFGALVASFPNTGFMGVPLLVALLGKDAAGPVVCTILVDLVFTSTLCIGLAQYQRRRSQYTQESWREVVWRTVKGPLVNPLPWAILLGTTSTALDMSLPIPLAQVVKMLGEAASPVALFTIGAVLWRSGQHAYTRTPVTQFLPVALIKLLIHPALVWGVGAVAATLGASVSPFGLTVLVLAAALPSATNVSLLAERYGANNGRIARIVMASTVLAFATFTLLAWALGVSVKISA